LLKDPSPDVRRTAALSLGKIALSEAVPALVQALRDRDPVVRQHSAWALGSIGEEAREKAAAALLTLLADPSPGVAETAGQAIGQLGASQPVVALLIKGLQQPAPNARRAAVRALAWLEAPSAYSALVQALGDSDALVRQGALAALGELGDSRAVSLMEGRLLHDPNEGVRSEAAFRLGKLGDQTVEASLRHAATTDSHEGVRRWAAWALNQSGAPGGPR
jgi:HEAT repeat protein